MAGRVLEMLRERGVDDAAARVLVLGLTFKEDCPDLRNSKVLDVVASLEAAGACVDVHDPWADSALAREEFGIDLVDVPEAGTYDAIVLAVAHAQFKSMDAAAIRALGKPGAVVYDVKSVWPRDAVDDRL